METKDFTDGYIYPGSIGLLINLCPTRYVSNDVYGIQRFVSWHELYYMPLKYRNMAMLRLLEYLCDEYEFLNGKKDLIIRSSNYWLEHKEEETDGSNKM